MFSEFISPNKVIKAVKFLVASSEMYKSYNIDVPTWLHDIETVHMIINISLKITI